MPNQVNILAYALEDDETVIELITELFDMNGLTDYKFFSRPETFIVDFNERAEKVHLCILDYYLPGSMTGLDVMKVVLSQNKNCKVIMISGQSNYKIVIDALNGGCFRYVDKNDKNHRTVLVAGIQDAIEFIKGKIDEKNVLEALKAEVRRRKSIYEANSNR